MLTLAEAPRPRSRSRPGHARRPAPSPTRVAPAAAATAAPVVLPHAAGGSLPGLASRHSAVGLFWGTRCQRLHLPAPLGSTGITRLRRYYGCSDSCWPVRAPFGFPAGLSASCAWPSDHSASKHLSAPAAALAHYPSARQASRDNGSGLRHWDAGSPVGPAESSSPKLRTGRSPPGASDGASRHRRTDQLQAGECVPEEDLHPSDQTHLQTHVPAG